MIDTVPSLEQTSGMMEVERYAVFDALHLSDDDPAIVAESGTFSGFSTAGDAFNLIMILIEVFLDVDFLVSVKYCACPERNATFFSGVSNDTLPAGLWTTADIDPVH